jgi:TRAP-type C4-dicarboxylate transport system substrate-binding protein
MKKPRSRIIFLLRKNPSNTKPRETSVRFQGRRASALYKPFVLALGCAAVVLPHSEVYQALDQGIVQAICAGEVGVVERAWHEKLKYVITPGFYTNEQVILVNLNTWNRLPSNVQQLFKKIMVDVEKESGPVIKEFADKERKEMLKAGMSEIVLSDGGKFLEIAYDAGWKTIIEKSPKYGEELKKLLSKK